LIPLVYRELHSLAHHYMAGEQPDATLQTTGLVNELYVRLVDVRRIGWTGRTHFFAVCAQLMRRVLVDVARSRKAAKRGGHAVHVPMDEHLIPSPEPPVDILALDEALDRLAAFDARKSRVVELRFGGLDVEETAVALDVSPQTCCATGGREGLVVPRTEQEAILVEPERWRQIERSSSRH
jgi:RNA polymerase sigma factor (TIGR02999 family)